MRGKTILKTFCVGLLLASVFGVAATGCSSTKTSATSSEEKTSLVVSYSVSVNAGEGVYASVNASSAVKGDTVKLTVVITDDNYDIKSVKVGSETLTGSADAKNASVYTYSYDVKEANVVFEVETYDVVAAKAYKIAYTDDAGLSHSDTLPTRADAGDEVTFNIATVSGYSVEGMSIYYMDGDEKVDVEFSGDSVTGYKFTMPDADVHIVPTVLGAYFKADFDSTTLATYANSYGREVEIKTSNFIHKMYVENGEDEDGNTIWEETTSYYARAGKKCVIVSKTDAVVRLTDFVIDGKTVKADEETDSQFTGMTTYSFTMPNSNSSIKAEVVNASVEGIVDISLDTTSSTHLDVEMFTIDETTAEDGTTKTYSKRAFDGKWKYGETIFIAASAKEGYDGYEAKTLVKEYTNYKTSYQTQINEAKDTTEWGTGYSYSDTHKADLTAYGSDIASAYTDKVVMQWTPSMSTIFTSIKVSVAEKYAQAYKDANIVKAGTFNGTEFYSFSTTGKVGVSTKTYMSNSWSVKADGSIYYGTSNKDVLPDGYDGTASFFEGQSGYKMFYDGGTAFAISYSPSYTLLKDLYVNSTKLTGTNSTIKLIYKLSSSNGEAGDAFLYGFYQDDAIVDYLLLYVDADGTLKGSSKVTVEVTDGTDPFVADAKVTVKDSATGTVLAKFNITEDSGSSDGDGTSTKDYIATWINDNGSLGLTISDDGTCTYNDVSNGNNLNGTYTYDESTKKGTMSTIGDWDGSNYFIFNDNGTLTVHLDDTYSENTVTLTMTKYNG